MSWRDLVPFKGESDEAFEVRKRTAYLTAMRANEPRSLTSQPISDLDRTPPAPLLLDRLDPAESTILYGPGGVGKGALACSWIAKLARDGLKVGILDYEGHGGEWARRLWGLAGDLGTSVEWCAPMAQGAGPLWSSKDQVRELIESKGIDYVVIDSAGMACGGDPLKPEAPIAFAEALQVLGVPSLTLGQVTKLHDARYPFGSVFWHYLARVTWSLMAKGEDVVLVNRKANNYRLGQAQTVTMLWQDGVLREVSERPANIKLEERIAEVLAAGPLSPVEIAEALNEGLPPDERVSRASVRSSLMRSVRSQGQFTVDSSGRYLLRHPVEE